MLTQELMEQALEQAAETGQSFPDVLATITVVPAADQAAAWAAALGVIYVDFASVVIEPDALALIPESIGRPNRAVPVALESDKLTVAFESPLDAAAVKAVSEHVETTDAELVVGLCETEGIEAALAAAYGGDVGASTPLGGQGRGFI